MLKKVFSLVLLVLSTVSFGQLKYSYIGDFKIENGSIIENCFVAYRTFGSLNDDSSNVVLFPTWFAGTSGHLKNHMGEGKIADTSKYFVIAVDALGDGVSSSPSNSKEQPKENFPLFTIHDMIESQYLMLSREFGFKKIFGIIGGSMGAMQVFEWITTYPGFIQKAVAYVGTPQQTFYDKLLWQIELNTIQLGIKCNLPDSIISDVVSAMQTSHIRSINYYTTKYRPEEFDDFIKKNIETYRKLFNGYDWASQLKAMMQHDIYKKFNSKEEAAKVFGGELFIIVGADDMMVNPKPAIEFAELSGSKLLILDNGCGHLAPGCEMEKFVKAVNDFFAGELSNYRIYFR